MDALVDTVLIFCYVEIEDIYITFMVVVSIFMALYVSVVNQ